MTRLNNEKLFYIVLGSASVFKNKYSQVNINKQEAKNYNRIGSSIYIYPVVYENNFQLLYLAECRTQTDNK